VTHYFARRVASLVPVLIGVSLIAFMLGIFAPGDPAPWADVVDALRPITLADVRAASAALPVPRDGLGALTHTRPAAVLMPIFEADGQARVVLTKRPETMPSHQGEIAFPGGKLEPNTDADLKAAALREAHEEIGIEPDSVEIVGELDHLVTVSARFALAPFVGLLATPPALVPHPREVAAVFDVAIDDLLAPEVFREERWGEPPLERAISFFELEDETIWGATAHILVDLLTIVLDSSTRWAG
jgi:8-oxo-dGTP pyrophosphatase MutT (NUDIX family)